MLLPIAEEKQQLLATSVKEQAGVLFLGEMCYIESSLMDGSGSSTCAFKMPYSCTGSLALDKSHGQSLENSFR